MGWVQQTKQQSRKSGGPQYYLQGIQESTRTVLEARGSCEVWLGTPYGVIESGLVAVAKDRVLDGDRLRPGKVGHDRIQRQRAGASIEGQIRHWYSLPDGEIVRVDFAEVLHKHALLLLPTKVHFSSGRTKSLCFNLHPLTFTENVQSQLLMDQVCGCRDAAWVHAQLDGVVRDHTDGKPHVVESDLLRTSGALSRLGIRLGCYQGKGYDCFDSSFQFGRFPQYSCPVEIKKRSSGFDYQVLKRTQPERATVLCVEHDDPSVMTPVVDVLELRALTGFLARHLEGRS
ncbi:MAG: hypothetical protein FJ290_20330 [Planctomycetes bacterium]|nr:hypothetical protein [Planctomycetota bacterium]